MRLLREKLPSGSVLEALQDYNNLGDEVGRLMECIFVPCINMMCFPNSSNITYIDRAGIRIWCTTILCAGNQRCNDICCQCEQNSHMQNIWLIFCLFVCLLIVTKCQECERSCCHDTEYGWESGISNGIVITYTYCILSGWIKGTSHACCMSHTALLPLS